MLISVLSSNTVVDDNINSRLSKANVALWCNHGISTATKVTVYRAAILSSLLYGCEGWTSDVNKDLTCKAKAKTKDLSFKDKAKDLTIKAKAKDLI